MRIVFRLCTLALIAWPRTGLAHDYIIPSPTHEQTFAYGSERHQAWVARGPDRHLALVAEFTNDPYVDRINPRNYDDFRFDFPAVRQGPDGRTFYYHPDDGGPVAVAEHYRGFLGLNEIRLLPNATLLIKKNHGLLSLAILASDRRQLAGIE